MDTQELIEKGIEEHQAFIDSFYKPEFSAYDFLCLYCAKLVERQIFHFSTEDLESFLDSCKKQGKYTRLISDIRLKSNGVFSYSENLGEAIFQLKWAGLLYVTAPEEKFITIDKDYPVEDMCATRTSYEEEMNLFVDEHLKMEHMELIRKF